jgi:preprotein translocase subunit SecF
MDLVKLDQKKMIHSVKAKPIVTFSGDSRLISTEEQSKENAAAFASRSKKLKQIRAELFDEVGETNLGLEKNAFLGIEAKNLQSLQDDDNDKKLDSDIEIKTRKENLSKLDLQKEFGGLTKNEAIDKVRSMSEAEQVRLQEELQNAMIDSSDILKNNVQNIFLALKADADVLRSVDDSADRSLQSMKAVNQDLSAKLKGSWSKLWTLFTLYMFVIISFFFMIFFMKLFKKS